MSKKRSRNYFPANKISNDFIHWERRIVDVNVPTYHQKLASIGVVVKEKPDDLYEELWYMINGLMKIGVFLRGTNGLTDTQLYTTLYHNVLPVITDDTLTSQRMFEYIDLLSDGTVSNRDDFLPYNSHGDVFGRAK